MTNIIKPENRVIKLNELKFKVDFVNIVSIFVDATSEQEAIDRAREMFTKDPESYAENTTQRCIVFEVKGGDNDGKKKKQ